MFNYSGDIIQSRRQRMDLRRLYEYILPNFPIPLKKKCYDGGLETSRFSKQIKTKHFGHYHQLFCCRSRDITKILEEKCKNNLT